LLVSAVGVKAHSPGSAAVRVLYRPGPPACPGVCGGTRFGQSFA
jgi:hypothetical protein